MVRNLAFVVLLLNFVVWMWGAATTARTPITDGPSATGDSPGMLQLVREASPDARRDDERGARCLRLGPVLSADLAHWLAERAEQAGAEVTVSVAGDGAGLAGAEHRYLEIRLAARIAPDWARNWVEQSPVGLGSEASFERIVCPER